MRWECGISGCAAPFDDVEAVIVHQATEHERCECKVCGTLVPDGYLSIRHAFEAHTRAEYVRAYGASSEDVREREDLRDEIEDLVDFQELVKQLE